MPALEPPLDALKKTSRRGAIENAVVEGLQADANVLTLHFDLKLLVDFRNHASTNGAATFADGKAQLFFHGDWRDQLNIK